MTNDAFKSQLLISKNQKKSKVYLSYFKSLTYVYSCVFFIVMALQSSLHLAGNIWLAKWSDANTADENENSQNQDVSYYLWIYGGIGIAEMAIKLSNDLMYYFR